MEKYYLIKTGFKKELTIERSYQEFDSYNS